MTPLIVAISGKRGAGKSTLANILIKDYGFRRVSFAAPLKDRVKRDFDLNEDQVNGHLKETVDLRYGRTPRDIMIAYGDMFRTVDPLYWVKAAEQVLLSSTVPAVIDDMRYENEALMLRYNGAYMVRLNRLAEDNIYKGEMFKPSECALDNYPDFNLKIYPEENRTLQHLEAAAERITSALNVNRRIVLRVLRPVDPGYGDNEHIDSDGVGC